MSFQLFLCLEKQVQVQFKQMVSLERRESAIGDDNGDNDDNINDNNNNHHHLSKLRTIFAGSVA